MQKRLSEPNGVLAAELLKKFELAVFGVVGMRGCNFPLRPEELIYLKILQIAQESCQRVDMIVTIS